MKNLTTRFLVVFFALTILSCDDDTSTSPVASYTDHLVVTTHEVIIPTYQSLYEESKKLQQAVSQLLTNPTEANLEATKTQWRQARVPWERSEGFLFGPVDTKGIDPAIDSWPVNVIDLEAVLASPDALTSSYLEGLEGTLKGFHTIEFLLFGTDGHKPLTAFNTRQFEYLVACAANLESSTLQLYQSWIATEGNSAQNITQAGQPNNPYYLSQKSALQEFVDGMITIADEVANGKINDPLAQNNIELEESRFSANSKADFADNIHSINNIYIGNTNKTPNSNSLHGLILAANPTLDAKIQSRITAAIEAIESIPGTFTEALTQNKAAIAAAQTAVRDLQFTLESELKPAIQSLP